MSSGKWRPSCLGLNVACQAPNHYLSRCCVIPLEKNWTEISSSKKMVLRNDGHFVLDKLMVGPCLHVSLDPKQLRYGFGTPRPSFLMLQFRDPCGSPSRLCPLAAAMWLAIFWCAISQHPAKRWPRDRLGWNTGINSHHTWSRWQIFFSLQTYYFVVNKLTLMYLKVSIAMSCRKYI